MIETHAHIYLDQFDKDIEAVMDRAAVEGVEKIYMPNIDSTSIDAMFERELRYPAVCFPTIGLHPCSVNKHFEKELYQVESWLGKRSFAAVGEIGTDLYWDKAFWGQQQEAFKIQCEWALKYDLPVVIHCRESIDETISLVRPFAERGLKGIFHCFTGTLAQALEIIDLGFLLGIGGVVTFKNCGLDKVLPEIGISHLVLETDSPYLAPVPYRGKRNEPSYLSLVVEKISALTDKERDAVISTTEKNALNLFKLPN